MLFKKYRGNEFKMKVLMENYKSRVIKYWNMLEERGLMARNVEN
jgi:hypothetical protein